MSDDEGELWVYVTDRDIAAARVAWVRAVDGDAPEARVALLRQDLELLWRAQARQVIAKFWRDVRAVPERLEKHDGAVDAPAKGDCSTDRS